MVPKEQGPRATMGGHNHNHLFVPATVFKGFTEELITIWEDSRPVCFRILRPLKDDGRAFSQEVVRVIEGVKLNPG